MIELTEYKIGISINGTGIKPTINPNEVVKYNIISPNVKSSSQTKEEIEIGNKGNNKLKSMSEFIDLCRVSAPNINSQFINSLKENKGFFRKKNNLGYNFLDMHKNYKEIISKTFS